MQIEFMNGSDAEAFHIPLTGLFADVEAGSGCVRLTDDFEECDAVNQLRIVDDWQRDLRELYKAGLVRLFCSRFANLPMARSEQIATFRLYCEQQGLACPPDVAAGLVAEPSRGCTSTTH